MKHCETCGKEVEPVWRFSQARCPECNNVIGEPIQYKPYVKLGSQEISMRTIRNLRKEGIL